MLVSPLNISFNSEIDLPRSKSESNRALMIMHYYGIQELKTQRHRDTETQRIDDFETLRLCDSESLMSNSDDTVLLLRHLRLVNVYYLSIVIDVINIALLLKIKDGIVLMVCEGRM